MKKRRNRDPSVRKKRASYTTEDERTKDLERKGNPYSSLVRKSSHGSSSPYKSTKKGGKSKSSKQDYGAYTPETPKKQGKGKYGKAKKQGTLSCSGKGRGKGGSSTDLGIPTECSSFEFADMSSSPATMGGAPSSDNCSPNLLHQLAEIPEMSAFLHLLAMADLTCMLHCGGPFTILAPTNGAFADLDPRQFSELTRPENRDMLQDLMLHHILPGKHLSPDLRPGPQTTMSAEATDVTLDPPMFDQSNVISPDNEACNGVVHGIDKVLDKSEDAGRLTLSVHDASV